MDSRDHRRAKCFGKAKEKEEKGQHSVTAADNTDILGEIVRMERVAKERKEDITDGREVEKVRKAVEKEEKGHNTDRVGRAEELISRVNVQKARVVSTEAEKGISGVLEIIGVQSGVSQNPRD